MLLNNRMASISNSPRHSLSNIKDISFISPPTASSLQYFNMRVTERLHRYRSLKRQWNEVAIAVQIDSSVSPKSESPIPNCDIVSSTLEQQFLQDYITSVSIKEKNSIELDPLHSIIQKDLIKLRKLIKSRQKKVSENIPSKVITNKKLSREVTAFDNQEQNNTKKLLSLNKSNTLDAVKISGCQMRPSTFPQTISPTNRNFNTGISLNTWSQCTKQQRKIRQQNMNRILSIYQNRVTHTLPSDSHIQGVPLPKKQINTSPKITTITSSKQTQPYRLSMPPIIKKKQPSFIKQETLLPPIRQPSITEETTTCLYNYAATTSSVTPNSMKLNRKTSVLPILLTSSSCIGIQPRRTHSGRYKETNDASYNLQDYKHLIKHLPKPIIPIIPRFDQGEYGILFEQLDHIRETMPDSHVYENYTRIC